MYLYVKLAQLFVRKHTIILPVLFLLVTSSFAYNPVPLDRDNHIAGRTNHPVLFVHGINSDASACWGVNSLVYNLHLNPLEAYVCEGQLRDSVVIASGMFPFVFGLVEANLRYNIYYDQSAPFGKHVEHVSKIRLSKFLFCDDLTPANILIDPNFNWPEQTISFKVYKRVNGVNHQIQSGTVKISLLDTLQKLAKNPSEISRGITAYTDRIVSFEPGYIPDFLAKKLELSTSFSIDDPDQYINSNGLYFYNAKRNILKDTTYYNFEVSPRVIGGEGVVDFNLVTIGHQPDPPYLPIYRIDVKSIVRVNFEIIFQGKPLTIIPVDVEVFSRENVFLNNNMYKPIVTGFTPDMHTVFYTVPLVNEPPINGNINLDSYYSQLGYFEELTTKIVDYKVFDGLVHPDWNTSLDHYGQANQLVDRMAEVLDEYYGKDEWKTNPNAVLDIVSHSQGGMVTRIAAFHSNDVSPANPVNHINRIVTLGTPHWGSAFATEPELLRDGNEDNEGKEYLSLADLRGQLLGNASLYTAT